MSDEVVEFWERELAQGKDQWYGTSLRYWRDRATTNDSVLGGLGILHETDIQGSTEFLQQTILQIHGGGKWHLKTCSDQSLVLDAGCGNGRVSRHLLSKHFNRVDLLEPAEHFLNAAAEAVGRDHLGATFCTGLQHFCPSPNTYDCVWFQWVLTVLTDDDLVALLKRCRTCLKPGGFIIVKENAARRTLIKDNEDGCVTRSAAYFEQIVEKIGLRIIRKETQKSWPPLLFAVNMYALRQ